ncbi:hypothetical protein [Natrinema sp. SYSU A 869]|uniref:hypothetical protein n=1 Tax=Natrinema sp. SYSU A 869 TaxID=2871694 RepID=UPI001CA4147F|nr:hypothetical protein [Natrinema sp. SYSU A 869]
MTDRKPVWATGTGTREPLLRLGSRWLVLLGTPLLLAIVLWFHPAAGDEPFSTLAPIADTWFIVHALLLPLFGLLGVALYMLLIGYQGLIATIGRIGIAIYLVCYLAFEAIAGIATAVLLRESRGLATDQQEGVATVIKVIFTEPIDGVAGILALLGTVGNLVAVLAIAVLLRRSGAPVIPLALLFGSPISIVAHGSTPMDAIGMLLFGLGITWLEFGWAVPEEQRSAA